MNTEHAPGTDHIHHVVNAEHAADHFHHVRDAPGFDLPGGLVDAHGHGLLDVYLPSVFGLQLTKFMVLQVVAAVIVFVIFRGLARRIAGPAPEKSRTR